MPVQFPDSPSIGDCVCVAPNVWSAGGALINNRFNSSGAGTQNSAIAANNFPTGITEEYNGISWTNAGTLIVPREGAVFGIQNSAVMTGGTTVIDRSCTEEYDGTVWTASGALIAGRCRLAGAGTQNAGLAFGGVITSPNGLTCTEEYNGTSWSSGGLLSVGRYGIAGAGTQNSALSFGGISGGLRRSITEEYDGTSWSSGGNLILAREGLAGVGIQNSALAFGGTCLTSPTPGTIEYVSCTEEYNGTSWGSEAGLIFSRYRLGGAGDNSSALAFGGNNPIGPSVLACTEEYSGTFPLWCWTGAYWNLLNPNATSGTSGTNTASTSGTSGSSGTRGESGTSGTSGESLSGSSGQTGVAGSSGTSGSSRTSGTSSQTGTSGNSFSSVLEPTNDEILLSDSAGGALALQEFRFNGTTLLLTSSFLLNSSSNFITTGSFSLTGSHVTSLSTSSFLIAGSTIVKNSAFISGSFMVLPDVSQSLNFANDTAAAAGGVPIGGLYRSASFMQIRLV